MFFRRSIRHEVQGDTLEIMFFTYVVAAFQAPPSPDYVPGLDEPEQAPPSPIYVPYVPKPVYPEFMPPEDEVFPAEEQPLPTALSPTANSPGYIADSDPEEDLTNYPVDGGDDDDDDDESSDDDDDDDDVEEDEEDEEEHPALADSIPPPSVYRTMARISIPAQTPTPFWSEADVDRFLAIRTPPPSPLTTLSSPLPHIPSPPLLASPPLPVSPTHPLGYRAAMIRLRAKAPSTSHSLPLPPPIILSRTRSDAPPSGTPPILPIPLPTSSPPLFEVRESLSAPIARPTIGFRVDYGFAATLDREIRQDPEREDIDEIYGKLDEAHKARAVLSGRLNLQDKDRRFHAYTALLIERGARLSREAWSRSVEASDIAQSKVMVLRTTVLAQQSEIAALRAADRTRQAQLMETLRLVSSLQTQVTALQGHDLRKMAPKRSTRSTPATETTTTTSITNAQLKTLINQGIAAALAARDADRSMNGDDNHNSGTGVRRTERVTRECTYQDFMKCQPLFFKGTEGVVELTQWFERMETVFRISNCTVENQIKFATCTLLGVALTWWNSHVRTVGHDVAYAMTWTDLKKKMTDKYCPKGEIKKLEVEMFPEESDKIEKYVGGLPDMIYGSVMTSKPKTMQDAIEMATELVDKKIITLIERQAENKRKFDDTSRNNQNQQQQNKRQNTVKAYTAGPGERKPYGGSKPLCPKCNYYHDSPCAPKCHKCNRVGLLVRDCKSPANANIANNQRGTGAGQNPTCYECRVQGHFKRECPKLKNNNRGNPVGSGNAPAKVYAIGNAGTNPDSNIVTGTFLLNNHYASILFDTGVDKSFMSTAFSSQIDITPTALDHF
ncbi:putative reverse transcriptase domain-containing protein [Tanacetum coccineum]